MHIKVCFKPLWSVTNRKLSYSKKCQPVNIHRFWVDSFVDVLTLYYTILTLKKKALENIVGKGENAGNEHFLLFP